MLNVFITVDTEMWLVDEFSESWREDHLEAEMSSDIYGRTSRGEFGLRYQLDVLNRYGLKAVFFVEAMFASGGYLHRLTEIVALVQGAGHEVQLHTHPEWLVKIDARHAGDRRGLSMSDFSAVQQEEYVGIGLANLRSAGATDVCAHRAGNFGASFETLRALAKHGISIDTSYNPLWFDRACKLRTPELLMEPTLLEGVWEFPVTTFRSGVGGVRHAQLAACSAQELEEALLDAVVRRHSSFVLVSHSFELIKHRKQGRPIAPDHIVIRRFDRLCRFLAEHRDTMTTTGFAGLDPAQLSTVGDHRPLSVSIYSTARRYAEQLVRRVPS